MSSSTSTASSSNPTRVRILDAAERLFVESGFAATSLRAITSEAAVNLAAVHYHFGSKEALFTAVVHRRVAPINALRLDALTELECQQKPPTVRDILKAFFSPMVGGEIPEILPRLIGRVYGEPGTVSRTLLNAEFGEVSRRFVMALGRSLPLLPAVELRWRFHFTVGAMIQSMRFDPLEGDSLSAAEKFEQLIEFAMAGFAAPPVQEVSE